MKTEVNPSAGVSGMPDSNKEAIAPAAAAPTRPSFPSDTTPKPAAVGGSTTAIKGAASTSAAPGAYQPIQVRPASRQLSLINGERAQAGLPMLAWNDCLASVAAENAGRLAAQGYLTATNGPAQDLACALGSTKTAESLGYWSSVSDTELNDMWLADPVERTNILGPFQRLGAAWAIAPTGVAYLVIEFG